MACEGGLADGNLGRKFETISHEVEFNELSPSRVSALQMSDGHEKRTVSCGKAFTDP